MLKILAQIEQAERLAKELRREHGPSAEAVAEERRRTRTATAPETALWSDVRRALRWV